MLFHIQQTHTPTNCPKNEGGSKVLYNQDVEGLELVAFYGSYSAHEIFYIVEADSMQAVNKFLDPGVTRCTSRITAVVSEPVER